MIILKGEQQYSYRRPSREEIEVELEKRPTKEHKIDYLKHLLLADEEAREFHPGDLHLDDAFKEQLRSLDREYHPENLLSTLPVKAESILFYPCIGFDDQGNRIIYEPDRDNPYTWEKDIEEQELRTEKYLRFIKRKLRYWENALTDEGPDLKQDSDSGPSANSRPLAHFKKRDQFADLLDRAYEEFFKTEVDKSCTKTEFFNRLAPLFAHHENPDQPYNADNLRKAATRPRLDNEESKANKKIIDESLMPPRTERQDD